MGQAGNWLLLIGLFAGLRLYVAAINFYRYASRPERKEPESKAAIK
jgi:hypothetical protein